MYIQGGNIMLVTLNKWGNSEAIRIPKILADTLGIHSGDQVELTIENDSLVIRKSELKGRELVASLLENLDAEKYQLNEEVNWDFVAVEEWDYEKDK
jgi:antitoxin MazE